MGKKSEFKDNIDIKNLLNFYQIETKNKTDIEKLISKNFYPKINEEDKISNKNPFKTSVDFFDTEKINKNNNERKDILNLSKISEISDKKTSKKKFKIFKSKKNEINSNDLKNNINNFKFSSSEKNSHSNLFDINNLSTNIPISYKKTIPNSTDLINFMGLERKEIFYNNRKDSINEVLYDNSENIPSRPSFHEINNSIYSQENKSISELNEINIFSDFKIPKNIFDNNDDTENLFISNNLNQKYLKENILTDQITKEYFDVDTLYEKISNISNKPNETNDEISSIFSDNSTKIGKNILNKIFRNY